MSLQLIFSFEPMLLKTYKGDENLSSWVMSQKLDGVRALWDGKSLKSRNQRAFLPPQNFIKCFPSYALDGEIYSPNLSFEEIISIVNSTQNKGWERLKLYVFDLPEMSGNLLKRLQVLKNFLEKTPCKFIEIIEQKPAISHQNVRNFFNKIIKNGGEGVVVRDLNAAYQSGRSDKILKLKKVQDFECKVVAHNFGKGKFAKILGSLTCQNLDGKSFKIGSGFSQKDRENPPKIGSIISYKAQGLTKNGLPRFPIFLRVRDDF